MASPKNKTFKSLNTRFEKLKDRKFSIDAQIFKSILSPSQRAFVARRKKLSNTAQKFLPGINRLPLNLLAWDLLRFPWISTNFPKFGDFEHFPSSSDRSVSVFFTNWKLRRRANIPRSTQTQQALLDENSMIFPRRAVCWWMEMQFSFLPPSAGSRGELCLHGGWKSSTLAGVG